MMALRRAWHRFWLPRVNYKAKTLVSLAKEDLALAQVIFTNPKTLSNIKPKNNRTNVDYYSDVADILVAQPGVISTLRDNDANVKVTHVSLLKAVFNNEHNDSDDRLENLMAIPDMLNDFSAVEIVTRLKKKSNNFIARTWNNIVNFFKPDEVKTVLLFNSLSANQCQNDIHARALRAATLPSFINTLKSTLYIPQMVQILSSDDALKLKLSQAIAQDPDFAMMVLRSPAISNLLPAESKKAAVIHGIVADSDFAQFVGSSDDLKNLMTAEEIEAAVRANLDFKNKILFNHKYAHFSDVLLGYTRDIHTSGLNDASHYDFMKAIKQTAENSELLEILRDNEGLLLKLFDCVVENKEFSRLILSDDRFSGIKNLLLTIATPELIRASALDNVEFFNNIDWPHYECFFEQLSEATIKELAVHHGIDFETKAEKAKRLAVEAIEEFNMNPGDEYSKRKFLKSLRKEGVLALSDLDAGQLAELRRCFDDGSFYPDMCEFDLCEIVAQYQKDGIFAASQGHWSDHDTIEAMARKACEVVCINFAQIHDKAAVGKAYKSAMKAAHPDKSNQSVQAIEAAQATSTQITIAKQFLDEIRPYLTQSILADLDVAVSALPARRAEAAFFNLPRVNPGVQDSEEKGKEEVAVAAPPSPSINGVD